VLFLYIKAWKRPEIVSQAACLSAGFALPITLNDDGTMGAGEFFVKQELEPNVGENAKARPYQVNNLLLMVIVLS